MAANNVVILENGASSLKVGITNQKSKNQCDKM